MLTFSWVTKVILMFYPEQSSTVPFTVHKRCSLSLYFLFLYSEVSPDLDSPPEAELVDAQGCFVLPGGIDPHTHFQLPFMGEVAVDDFYTGTRAALAGGTTMVSAGDRLRSCRSSTS